MADDTVLSGRWSLNYKANNRQQRIWWSGGAAAADTVKSLYLALADLFHSGTQMDDGSPMKADTPTEYIIGIIDAGAVEPWFIDKTSMEHLKGGALKTASWKRVQDSNTGIIVVPRTGSNIVEGDIGNDIVGQTDGDTGTLLDVQTSELWIRPDSSAIGNSFDNTSQNLICNAHTDAQSGAPTTGEMLWANVYNTGIASLSVGTHQYGYQGVKSGDTAPDARIEKYKTAGEDWWSDGTFDVLVLVADQAASLSARADFVDEGYVSFFARQYSETYSFYIVDLFAGGRNPIPMETGNDLNNPTGHKRVTTGTHTGTFLVGEEFNDNATGLERGIITAVVDNTSIDYYPIGDPQDAFEGTEPVTGETSGATCTISGAPTNIGPAAMAGLAVSYGSENTHDVDNDGNNEYYSIDIDVSAETLVDAFEWAKYTMRNGSQGTGDTDAIEAEQFIGIDYIVDPYTTLTGALANGDVVTQDVSLATGTVVAHHTTPKILTLRNCRGDFDTTNEIKKDVGNKVSMGGASVARKISPIKACPWGVFAGGTWFLAQGCVLTNRVAGDANSYQVVDDEGNLNKEPTQVTVYVGDTRIKDWISLLRMTAGVVEKDFYDLDTIANVAATAISVNPAIRTGAAGQDVGEPSAGSLVIITSGKEYVYRYTSFTGDDFTLFAIAQKTCDAGGTVTELNDVSEDFVAAGVKVGDIVRNDTHSEYGYVTKVETTKLTTTEMTNAWDSDLYTVGAVVASHAVDDYLYVFLMHVYETAGTDGAPGNEQIGLIYEGDETALLRARHANDSSYNIKPFSLPVTIGSGGLTQNIIRQDENITS